MNKVKKEQLVRVSLSEYKKLLISDIIYQHLVENGVDNWGNYSLPDQERLDKAVLEQLMSLIKYE